MIAKIKIAVLSLLAVICLAICYAIESYLSTNGTPVGWLAAASITLVWASYALMAKDTLHD